MHVQADVKLTDIEYFVRLESCCSAYKNKESFDVHHTSCHSEQSPLPDKLKTGWFCLTNGYYLSKGRKDVQALPVAKKGCI